MSKKVTMQHVADLLGVSKVTVSKALRGNQDISEAMREKIRATADEIGYIYHNQIDIKSEDNTHSIGIITSVRNFRQDDLSYIELYKLLSSQFEERHSTVVFYIIDSQSEKNLQLPNTFMEKRIEGMIVLGQFSKAFLSEVVALQLPIIFLDFYCNGFDVDSVNTDNFFGTYEITNLLIERGHRKIAFVGNLTAASPIQDRCLGYYKSLLEYGLPFHPAWLIGERYDDTKVEIDLPDEMPTAFVCGSDKTAKALIKTLNDRGLRVPDDCSVVGFGDSTHAVETEPHISTVHVNLEKLARSAAGIIVRKIEDPSSNYGRVLVKGGIVIRDSVKTVEPGETGLPD